MSLKMKIFLFVSIICFNIKSLRADECDIHLTEDIALRPKVLLNIGSRRVDIKVNEAKNKIVVFENQKVEVICKTKFESPHRYSDKHKIELICGENLSFYSSEEMFKCSPQQWNLYESLENFVWCPKNTSSYIIARSSDTEANNFQYLAGVCYDIQQLSFKSLYYTISSKRLQNLSPSILNNLHKPGLELEHIKETFGSNNAFERDYGQQAVQNWISFTKYNYSSIIQNNLLLDEYNDQFGTLLDLIWWPSLRLGNWQRYETALKNHLESEETSFDILAGVSAVAAVPIIKSCDTNFTWQDLEDKRNNKIPLYIWNYVRSTTNSSDEIVIIGVNTPFYEFYPESDIVFCQDRCQEISWLKKTSSTFRYSALGIIFCCSSEDVKLSKRLDGFPEFDMNTKPEVGHATSVDSSLEEAVQIYLRNQKQYVRI